MTAPRRLLAGALGRDAHTVHAVGLAAADAHRGLALRQHNGVGLDVLAGAPGKAQRRPLGLGGLALRDDFPFGRGRVAQVHVLAQHAAVDRAQFIGAARWSGRAIATRRQFLRAARAWRASVGEARRGNALHKQVTQRLGGGHVKRRGWRR